jgi:hypothetical protein
MKPDDGVVLTKLRVVVRSGSLAVRRGGDQLARALFDGVALTFDQRSTTSKVLITTIVFVLLLFTDNNNW